MNAKHIRVKGKAKNKTQVHLHLNPSALLLQIVQILQIGVIFTPKAPTFPHDPKYLNLEAKEMKTHIIA